ncbi:MAG: phosphate ABC transporter permease subunit PstC [Clostridia bacterium]|nr:phosphate ABC transporter permease subunit PstC [Clostridia bacterium]
MQKDHSGRMGRIFNRENVAKAIFIFFAAFSIIAVLAIVVYILTASIPAFQETGFFKFIFGSQWDPDSGTFGVFAMIVTTLVLTACSVILGGILAVFMAVFIVYYCPKKLKGVFSQIINLLAGIPSIIFGYFGLELVKPALENMFGTLSGSGLLLSTLILSVMILPTVCSITKNSLESVPMHYYEGALALGCTKNQAVFRVMLPAARNGILAAMILGIGRAVGETMAVQFLLGGAVNYPSSWFIPLRSLTSNIVMEFGYATGTHRSALIATGFILLLFILIINLILWVVKRNNAVSGNSFFSRKVKEGHTAENMQFRKAGSVQDVLAVISWIVSILVTVILVGLVVYVFVRGVPYLTTDFVFGESSYSNITMAPAFASTALVIVVALVFALPFGIGAAIFLNEYAKKGSWFVKVVRLFIDTLAGVPSIIFGLFGYLFFGVYCGMGVNIFNGGLTMALMILPTIIRSTEQSLSEVPDSMREASYALGAGKLRTVFTVVLPQAIAGIITSVILSIGRIIGETAALIYTVGMSAYMPTGLFSSGSTLAVLMYSMISEGLEVGKSYAVGTVLIIFVFLLNLLVSLIERIIENRRAGKKNIFKRIQIWFRNRKNPPAEEGYFNPMAHTDKGEGDNDAEAEHSASGKESADGADASAADAPAADAAAADAHDAVMEWKAKKSAQTPPGGFAFTEGAPPDGGSPGGYAFFKDTAETEGAGPEEGLGRTLT